MEVYDIVISCRAQNYLKFAQVFAHHRRFTMLMLPSLRQSLCSRIVAAATAILQQQQQPGGAAALHSWALASQSDASISNMLALPHQPYPAGEKSGYAAAEKALQQHSMGWSTAVFAAAHQGLRVQQQAHQQQAASPAHTRTTLLQPFTGLPLLQQQQEQLQQLQQVQQLLSIWQPPTNTPPGVPPISNPSGHLITNLSIEEPGSAAVDPLLCIKRTYQPHPKRWKRKHGFLKRMATKDGREIIKRRKAKGRWRLSI